MKQWLLLLFQKNKYQQLTIMIYRHELHICGSLAKEFHQSKIDNSTPTQNRPASLITYRVCNQVFKGQSKFQDPVAEAYFMKHMQKSKIASIKESQLTQDSEECHAVELQETKQGILQKNREENKWIDYKQSNMIILNTLKRSAIQKQNWGCENKKIVGDRVKNTSMGNTIIENLSQVISQDDEEKQKSKYKTSREQIQYLRRQLEEKDEQICQMKQIARQSKKKQDMLEYRLKMIQRIASINHSSDKKHEQAMESAALRQIAEQIIDNLRA